jgi:hypothetical protein
MTDYTQLMAKYATYLPAIPPGPAEYPVCPDDGKRLPPAGLTKGDLNFLGGESNLFTYGGALMSAGLALGQSSERIPRAMITDCRHRLLGSTVLWDSGGFQLIRDKIRWRGDHTRERILRACEHFADVAVFLDCPPVPLVSGPNKGGVLNLSQPTLSKQFPTYEICRDTTVANNRYYEKHRRYGPRPWFLNVLQGNNFEQCEDWYQHVKVFEMDGWAFGGTFYNNLTEILRRLIILRDDYMLDGRRWVHVLGSNILGLTCALTTIQTILSRELGRLIKFSYDTSSPFTMVYGYGLAHTGFAIDKSGLSMKQRRFPNDDYSTAWDQIDFPTCVQTALSRRLKLSDICLQDKSIFAASSWDTLSYHLLANHNREMLLNAIIGAHRVYLLDDRNASGLCPDWLIRSRIGIEEVLISQNPMDAIAKYSADFDMVFSGGRVMNAAALDDDYYDKANRG